MTGSREQLDYLDALAEKKTCKQVFDSRRQHIDKAWEDGGLSDEEWAKQVTELEFSCGYAQAQTRLIEAERQLVAWAKATLEQRIDKRELEPIAVVWERWYLPSVKDKVIEACMKL